MQTCKSAKYAKVFENSWGVDSCYRLDDLTRMAFYTPTHANAPKSQIYGDSFY